MKSELADVEKESFICPECGSRRSGGHNYLDPRRFYGSGEPRSPWDTVLQTFDCADCFNTIPGHLAQRWEGRTVKGAQLEWSSVFRPLRDEGQVHLINLLAAGWEIVGEGNDEIELWDVEYDVCASIEGLIDDINCRSDEPVNWSFLVAIDGIRNRCHFLASEVTNIEELLSLIDSVTLEENEWSRGARSGVYKHLLVRKVDRYRVIKALKAISTELMKQLEIARMAS
jgi:hypothetical protein